MGKVEKYWERGELRKVGTEGKVHIPKKILKKWKENGQLGKKRLVLIDENNSPPQITVTPLSQFLDFKEE